MTARENVDRAKALLDEGKNAKLEQQQYIFQGIAVLTSLATAEALVEIGEALRGEPAPKPTEPPKPPKDDRNDRGYL